MILDISLPSEEIKQVELEYENLENTALYAIISPMTKIIVRPSKLKLIPDSLELKPWESLRTERGIGWSLIDVDKLKRN